MKRKINLIAITLMTLILLPAISFGFGMGDIPIETDKVKKFEIVRIVKDVQENEKPWAEYASPKDTNKLIVHVKEDK